MLLKYKTLELTMNLILVQHLPVYQKLDTYHHIIIENQDLKLVNKLMIENQVLKVFIWIAM